MTFVLIGANNPRVQWHMAGQQSVGHHAFLKAEILGRVSCIDGWNGRLELLPVAARMHRFTDIKMSEDGEPCGCIGNALVRLAQCFKTNKISGGGSSEILSFRKSSSIFAP